LLWHFVSSMIEHSTPGMLHTVLTSLYHRYRGRSEWKQLLVLATDRFGCLVDQLVPCLEEQEREIKIVARREKVHDSVHRFFLALLLNVPNRPSIYRLIKERFPDSDPEQLVLRWVREMAEQKLLGLDFNEVSLHLLECALRQCDFIGAKASLARAFRLKNTQEESEQLLNLWNELLAAVALRPLFDEGREAATRSPSADESVVCHTRHDPSRQTLQPSGMRTMEMHNSLTQPERSSGPAPQGFRENGYAVLRNSIETRMAGGLYRYVRTRAEQRCIRPDSQVPDSPAAYADPNMEMLLVKFRP